MKYTPGPWHIRKSFDKRSWFCIAHTEKGKHGTYRPEIATVYTKPTLVEDDKGEKCEGIAHANDLVYMAKDSHECLAACEANALLIAAAPELLEALEEMQQLVKYLIKNAMQEQQDKAAPSLVLAKLVIAKAKGNK